MYDQFIFAHVHNYFFLFCFVFKHTESYIFWYFRHSTIHKFRYLLETLRILNVFLDIIINCCSYLKIHALSLVFIFF